MKLSYVIKFVADMNRAVKFYRDVLTTRRALPRTRVSRC